MENVMEMVQGPLMGEVFGRISGFFRESPDGVKRGFESAVPLSMAGLAERASTQEGAQDLLSTFKGGQYPHLDAGELGRAVADPETAAGVARSSEGFLSRLFGNKQGGVVDGLASSAGVSASSASKLLGLALPMVLGFVGKQAVSRNLDASGLRGFLTSQRKQMGDVLPGSLSRLVGGDAEAQRGASERQAVAHSDAVPKHKPRSATWALVALAAIAGLVLLLSRRAARREAPQVRTFQTQDLGRVSRPTALQAGSMGPLTQALSGGIPLPRRFVLSELTFRTDSAEIDPTSARVLDDVAQAMAAHPSARIRVEGHTDNTGVSATNQALSQARAESTRAYLVSRGIDGARIDAAGYGADHPLTTNDTAEGRAENRRTEIVVIQS
jgi:outer membrane protein OmpA-like peptidoglycan-associated protein